MPYAVNFLRNTAVTTLALLAEPALSSREPSFFEEVALVYSIGEFHLDVLLSESTSCPSSFHVEFPLMLVSLFTKRLNRPNPQA
jgi:hypothetical protein